MLFIPPDARWLGLCDALSLAHVQALALGGAGLVLLAALPLPNWWARLSGLLLLGGVVAASAWVSHPQCLGDPSALIDEDARRLRRGHVREARPIYGQPIQTLSASRTEEQTTELKSNMHIAYPVSCSKKKKTTRYKHHTQTPQK